MNRRQLLQGFLAAPAVVTGNPPNLAVPCTHRRWRIRDTNRFGYATCLDCGREVCLDEILNALAERLDRQA